MHNFFQAILLSLIKLLENTTQNSKFLLAYHVLIKAYDFLSSFHLRYGGFNHI